MTFVPALRVHDEMQAVKAWRADSCPYLGSLKAEVLRCGLTVT